jgi:hypothetical protein
MGYTAALIYNRFFFYELATYYYEDEYGAFNKHYLHVGDIVMIQEQEEYDESYVIIEAIFSHRGNNNKLYAFVIVKWFEETFRIKLGCPIYKIQTDNQLRCIFPLSAIDLINKAHFIHDCDDSCTMSHNLLNTNYIKNMYYFNAI